MNLTYYQNIPQDSTLNEIWTPAYRYFESLYPIPLPHINLTAGNRYCIHGNPTATGNNMLCTTNTALFEAQGSDGTGNTTIKSTGFTRRLTLGDNGLLSVTRTIPTPVIKIKFRALVSTHINMKI